jgi:hypothetical protein
MNRLARYYVHRIYGTPFRKSSLALASVSAEPVHREDLNQLKPRNKACIEWRFGN